MCDPPPCPSQLRRDWRHDPGVGGVGNPLHEAGSPASSRTPRSGTPISEPTECLWKHRGGSQQQAYRGVTDGSLQAGVGWEPGWPGPHPSRSPLSLWGRRLSTPPRGPPALQRPCLEGPFTSANPNSCPQARKPPAPHAACDPRAHLRAGRRLSRSAPLEAPRWSRGSGRSPGPPASPLGCRDQPSPRRGSARRQGLLRRRGAGDREGPASRSPAPRWVAGPAARCSAPERRPKRAQPGPPPRRPSPPGPPPLRPLRPLSLSPLPGNPARPLGLGGEYAAPAPRPRRAGLARGLPVRRARGRGRGRWRAGRVGGGGPPGGRELRLKPPGRVRAPALGELRHWYPGQGRGTRAPSPPLLFCFNSRN